MICTTSSTFASMTTISSFTFGSMSTEYAVPARPAWTMPFCTPRPVTPTILSPM